MRTILGCTMVVLLCASGLAFGQSGTRVLQYDGNVLEVGTPDQSPTLGEVLDAHGVVLDQAESVERFLAGILRPSLLGADEVHALQVWWIGADPPSDPMRDPLQVDVVATIGSNTALVNIYIADGTLHMAVTLYDQDGEAAFFRLQSDILEPVAVLGAVDDAPLVPGYLVVPTLAMKCTCDDNKGTQGCTKDDCEEIRKCPKSENGYSCALQAMVLVPPEEPLPADPSPGGQTGP